MTLCTTNPACAVPCARAGVGLEHAVAAVSIPSCATGRQPGRAKVSAAALKQSLATMEWLVADGQMAPSLESLLLRYTRVNHDIAAMALAAAATPPAHTGAVLTKCMVRSPADVHTTVPLRET